MASLFEATVLNDLSINRNPGCEFPENISTLLASLPDSTLLKPRGFWLQRYRNKLFNAELKKNAGRALGEKRSAPPRALQPYKYSAGPTATEILSPQLKN